MPQEFEPPTLSATEQFAAQQKATPEEVSAALDALHERQQAPIDFDLDLSIGQVLDELDLPLPASDLWREVQAQRVRKAQAAAVTQTDALPPRRPRRRIVAAALVAGMALATGNYLLKPRPDLPNVSVSRSVTTNNAPQINAPQINAPQTVTNSSANNATNNRTNNVTLPAPQSTVNVSPLASGTGTTSAAQNGTNTQTAQNPVRPRQQLPEPGNIINGDNQTRTLTPEDGQVVIGGSNDTVTVQGRADLVIVNGNRGVVRLRGTVGQLIIGGGGNKVTYSRAFPAPQIIDNGSGNVVRAE